MAEYRQILLKGHLADNAWGHELRLRSKYVHPPDVDKAVRDIRRRMIEGSFQRRWDDMTPHEQLAFSGWVGFIETAVAEWINQGAQDQELLLEVMLDGRQTPRRARAEHALTDSVTMAEKGMLSDRNAARRALEPAAHPSQPSGSRSTPFDNISIRPTAGANAPRAIHQCEGCAPPSVR